MLTIAERLREYRNVLYIRKREALKLYYEKDNIQFYTMYLQVSSDIDLLEHDFPELVKEEAIL